MKIKKYTVYDIIHSGFSIKPEKQHDEYFQAEVVFLEDILDIINDARELEKCKKENQKLKSVIEMCEGKGYVDIESVRQLSKEVERLKKESQTNLAKGKK